MFAALLLCITGTGLALHGVTTDTASQRNRVVVTTDGEIDDRSSLVRFLMYATEWETEAIIATNSIWQKDGHGTGWIQHTIDRYAAVYDNLMLHDARYPHPDSLRERVLPGNEDRLKMHRVGPDNDSPGSRKIVDLLLDSDPRPVWLLAWGGTNTIAQALWRLQADFGADQLASAVSKARIHAIAIQDETIWWIKRNMPDVPLLLNYQYVAMDYNHEGHPLSNDPMFDTDWLRRHVKSGHGPLGAGYPQAYLSEGDSPSFLHLLNTGLRSAENPSYGGWGGRFQVGSSVYPKFWTVVDDDGDVLKPLWRWLPAIQNDFAARMDWCVNDFHGANHPPVVQLKEYNVTIRSGGTLLLDPGQTYDPDGDALAYTWERYTDADSFDAPVELRSQPNGRLHFVAPAVKEKQTIHLILAAMDDGIPQLTRYGRVIVTVRPNK